MLICSSIAPAVGFDLASAWTRAREQAGVKQEALAAFMGIAPHQLADQLAGRGHLSLQRVLLIAIDPDGRQFLRHLAIELAVASGMSDDELWLLARVQHAVLGLVERMQKRIPAKAQLREKREQERA